MDPRHALEEKDLSISTVGTDTSSSVHQLLHVLGMLPAAALNPFGRDFLLLKGDWQTLCTLDSDLDGALA